MGQSDVSGLIVCPRLIEKPGPAGTIRMDVHLSESPRKGKRGKYLSGNESLRCLFVRLGRERISRVRIRLFTNEFGCPGWAFVFIAQDSVIRRPQD